MRIFVYEAVCAGAMPAGNGAPGRAECSSLLREGRAMVAAAAADFSRLPSIEAHLLWDQRLNLSPPPDCHVSRVDDMAAEREQFAHLARSCDWTALIAPELDELLLSRALRVQQVGGRLLGPGPGMIQLAGDKQATADCLAAAGVPVPVAVLLRPGDPLPRDFPYPAVIKPRLGAGSLGVRRVQGPAAGQSIHGELGTNRLGSLRLERYCPGMPASVSLLCGPRGRLVLPACRQRLGGPSGLEYLGGELPLEPALARRATRLAQAALDALDGPLVGYLGVDLVLGDDPQGRDDVVIEINPRLTTSYVGLRAITAGNLAAAMLALARGEPAHLSFTSDRVEFSADGRVIGSRGSGLVEQPGAHATMRRGATK